eukprot:TRINITY_DN3726_c0_g1_i1.p1 TRINITY_DN3726_c0_g1~~TRINITY_DN3726_c0_g1_i1.p1  ORF type:complete len:114 (-),score=18.13 TRINITY_DN3726_c0_g1_i1:103-444(-)
MCIRDSINAEYMGKNLYLLAFFTINVDKTDVSDYGLTALFEAFSQMKLLSTVKLDFKGCHGVSDGLVHSFADRIALNSKPLQFCFGITGSGITQKGIELLNSLKARVQIHIAD